MTPQACVQNLVPHLTPQKTSGYGQADVNIALSKYWGKRQVALNLPTQSSLSITLPGLGTQTHIQPLDAPQDRIELNGQALKTDTPFAQRISRYLDGFRPSQQAFLIQTINSVPTAAGLASSASGYAALALALNDLFDWQLDAKSLSILARMGSGSASRSIYSGFAIWHKGERDDGLDSYAQALNATWPSLCIGLIKINTQAKPIGSSAGMQHTVDTCPLYQAWPQQAEQQLKIIQNAIETQNFTQLGETAEHNALTMHATMIATWPPILYWQPESIQAMQTVWQLRQQGIEVYFTMDAGPNLKLLFEQHNRPAIERAFSQLETIQPFKQHAIHP